MPSVRVRGGGGFSLPMYYVGLSANRDLEFSRMRTSQFPCIGLAQQKDIFSKTVGTGHARDVPWYGTALSLLRSKRLWGKARHCLHFGRREEGRMPTKVRFPVISCNEGEADNPGPETRVRVASANVTSLKRRWPIACRWEFDVLAVQETKLGEEAQKALEAQVRADGWEPVWGEPMPLRDKVREGNIIGLNVNDARYGGVAVIARDDLPIQKVDPSSQYEYLFEEGRLVHSFLPWEEGRTGVHILSLYGCANAETAEERRSLNMTLYKGVLRYADTLGRVPCLICGDCNPNPAEADLVMEALAGTQWIDVFAEWHGGPDVAPITYSREGPIQGMSGKGATRPDRIVVNREAMVLVASIAMHYDLDNAQHAVLSVTLDKERFGAMYKVQKKPRQFDKEIMRKNAENEVLRERIASRVGRWVTEGRRKMMELVERNNMDEAMQCWAEEAESQLMILQEINGEDENKYRGRSCMPIFKERKSTARLQKNNACAGAITHRHSEIACMQRRVAALAAMTKKQRKMAE